MASPPGLMVFMVAGLLLNLAPGPDVLFIVARSLSQGRAAGMVSALGIGAGCLVHVTAAVAGMSTLLLRLPALYQAMRWLGAAYLLYLGARALTKKVPAAAALGAPSTLGPERLRRIFWQGFMTNALNPKVALFFAAFLPQFVDPARGALPAQFLMLGLLFNLSGTIVNLAYAAIASRFATWLRRHSGARRVLDRIAGGVFIALGVRLALADRR
jgi:threonine/homoserine/homoserine lactone efflux protein